MRRALFLSTLIAAASLAGCYGTVGFRGSVTATAPDLVVVSPGVQVIADYDEPIFYSDGFYWRFDNGMWYRSGYYTGGWVYIQSPPVAVLRIDQPYRYRHYRPRGYVRRGPPPQRQGPVRDHRRQPPPPPPRRGPDVRDHRDDRSDRGDRNDQGRNDRGDRNDRNDRDDRALPKAPWGNPGDPRKSDDDRKRRGRDD